MVGALIDMEPNFEDHIHILEATIENDDETRAMLERVLLEQGLEEAIITVVTSWGEKQRARAEDEVDKRAGPYWEVCPPSASHLITLMNISYAQFLNSTAFICHGITFSRYSSCSKLT